MGFLVIIISAIAEGVRVGDMSSVVRNIKAVFIRNSDHLAPRIVGISRNARPVGVLDSDDVTLQVLMEIICCVVIDDTADRVLVVVQRNQGTVAPGFLQDLGAVELVGVQYAASFISGTRVLYHTG